MYLGRSLILLRSKAGGGREEKEDVVRVSVPLSAVSTSGILGLVPVCEEDLTIGHHSDDVLSWARWAKYWIGWSVNL